MPQSKLSQRDKEEIYHLACNGHKQKKLADFYDVSQGTISNVIKEERYREALRQKDALLSRGLALGVEAAIHEKVVQSFSTTNTIDVAEPEHIEKLHQHATTASFPPACICETLT